MSERGRDAEREELSLAKAAQYLLDEARMVLPGIQALFGFQLVAVFSERFSDLSELHQQIHYAAITLVVLSIALVMTPAAYHRHQEARVVTYNFIVASTRLLLLGMLPLSMALCLDFYVVGQMLIEASLARALAWAMFALFIFLWGIFPRTRALHRKLAF